MVVLGLTGSVGMGKSTTAQMFRDEGVPVWDADAAVHALYSGNAEVQRAVAALAPGAVGPSGVDRARLRDWVTATPGALKRLEAAVHPFVAAARAAFLARERDRGVPLVVLDIPLLFETGADREVDAVAVVSVPPEVQRARVTARPGMTEAAFAAILARQMPDAEKRARARYVIGTLTLDSARRDVRRIVRELAAG